MRGKIVLSLTLALVMLLGALPTSHAQTTTLSVNPSFVTAMPDEIFSVDIEVADVVDLYTFAFDLRFAPFGNTLAVRRVLEGPFLGSDAMSTDFSYTVSTLEGSVKVGSTRLGEVGGIDGSGVLATIEFKVVEAGDSALELTSTVLEDSSVDSLIPHVVVNGYFNGGHADLVGPAVLEGVLGNSPVAKVGDSIVLSSSVTQVGAALPLTVTVRYDLIRTDGRILSLWSPQPKTYVLYADGYDGSWSGAGWTEYGTAVLDAIGDGNYVEAADYCSIGGMWSFSDLAFGPGETVTSVVFEAYSTAQSGAIDGDAYVFNNGTAWYWGGSIEASSDWGWYFSDAGIAGAFINEFDEYDETLFNSLEILLHYWTPDGSSGPTMTIDAMRLVVTTAVLVTIDAADTISMPTVVYTLTVEDAGIYRGLRATVYYTYYGTLYNQGNEQPIIVQSKKKARDYLIVVVP